jgi:hypothetical protein
MFIRQNFSQELAYHSNVLPAEKKLSLKYKQNVESGTRVVVLKDFYFLTLDCFWLVFKLHVLTNMIMLFINANIVKPNKEFSSPLPKMLVAAITDIMILIQRATINLVLI